MKIDYNKIKERAERLKMSPHLLVKRIVNYRKAEKDCGDCAACQNVRYIGRLGDNRKTCAIIGESLSPTAQIFFGFACNEFKRF